MLSWLIALFDTLVIFHQFPIKANSMIIQQFHRLNGINHLNLIRRGREIIGEDRTNWILLNSLLLILIFSSLFAVVLYFMDHSLLTVILCLLSLHSSVELFISNCWR